jgi:hypothetical protein
MCVPTICGVAIYVCKPLEHVPWFTVRSSHVHYMTINCDRAWGVIQCVSLPVNSIVRDGEASFILVFCEKPYS